MKGRLNRPALRLSLSRGFEFIVFASLGLKGKGDVPLDSQKDLLGPGDRSRYSCRLRTWVYFESTLKERCVQ